MSAHVRPDDAPLALPGLEPDPIHEALAALSRAADAVCSRAAMGCSMTDVREGLTEVGLALARADLLASEPWPAALPDAEPCAGIIGGAADEPFDDIERCAREWAHAAAVTDTAREHYLRGGDGSLYASADRARFDRRAALDDALRAVGLCVSHADTLRAIFCPVDKSGGP